MNQEHRVVIDVLQDKIKAVSVKALYAEGLKFNSAWDNESDPKKAAKSVQLSSGYQLNMVLEDSGVFRLIHAESGYYVLFNRGKSKPGEAPMIEFGRLLSYEYSANQQRQSRAWV